MTFCFSVFNISGCRKQQNETLRKNVLLITIDALRADHLGCYGYDRQTSPHIDKLASEGILFENALAQAPHTHSAMAAMMTGTYPVLHNSVNGSRLINPALATLAETLKANGYATKAVVQNYWLTEEIGFARGFDEFNNHEQPLTDADIEKSILRRLNKPGETPFFLWLHYLEPHAEYIPRMEYIKEFIPDYEGDYYTVTLEMTTRTYWRPDVKLAPETMRYIKACYDSEIRFCDESIGRILQRLEKSELSEHTLVVLTADHGEEFKDHGRMGHDHGLYQELLHIPLIVRAPGIMAAGKRIAEAVEAIDIMPTVLSFCGCDIPELTQGENLLPLIQGKRDEKPGAAVSQRYFFSLNSHLVSLFHPPWKLIAQINDIDVNDFHNWKLAPPRLGVNLFNIRNDPGETENLAAQNTELVMRLIQMLQSWYRKNRPPYFRERLNQEKISDDLKRNLEALGYLQ